MREAYKDDDEDDVLNQQRCHLEVAHMLEICRFHDNSCCVSMVKTAAHRMLMPVYSYCYGKCIDLRKCCSCTLLHFVKTIKLKKKTKKKTGYL